MISKKNILETKPAVAPRFALVAIVLLFVTFISVLMIQRLASPGRNVQASSANLVQATQEFAAGEEMTLSAANLTVRIPRNSITWTGSIVISSRDPALFLVEGDTEWTRPQIFSVEFVNGKGTAVPGIIFSNPVQICFKLTSEQWKDFRKRPDAYQVQYFAVEQNPQVWVSLPVKAYSGEMCGIVHHLSLFALAIKSAPIIPITGPSQTSTVTRTEPSPTRRSGPERVPTATSAPPAAQVPPTEPPTAPPTEPSLTEPPATEPSLTEPPPTDPPPTDPPPTDPPPTDPPPTDPPPPPPTDPPTVPPGP